MNALIVLTAVLACATAQLLPNAAHLGYGYGWPHGLGYPGYGALAYTPYAGVHAPLTTANYASPLSYASASVAAPFSYAATPVTAPISYAAAPSAAPISYAAAPVAAPVSYASQYHAQDEFGQASYGHRQLDQTHNAVRDAFGNVAGEYSYISPEGKTIVTKYTAGANGFQVASNAVPVAPVDTKIAPVYTGVAPAPVSVTPEVAKATAEHLAAHAKALAAASEE